LTLVVKEADKSSYKDKLETIDLEDKIKEESKKYYLELDSFISVMHYSIVILEK
jgi:hypothetical protein